MKNRHSVEEKSRLGRLLIGLGYLSDHQVEEGLRLQRKTGHRLGEVFVQSDWLTEAELHRVLKHQSWHRNAAALVALALLPLTPMIGVASELRASAVQSGSFPDRLIRKGGLAALTDAEMAMVTGQGDEPIAISAKTSESVVPLTLVADALAPAWRFLDSEITFAGVRQHQDMFPLVIDGIAGLKLGLPERIERIRLANIRVGSGPVIGTVTLSDVQFSGESSLTVHAR